MLKKIIYKLNIVIIIVIMLSLSMSDVLAQAAIGITERVSVSSAGIQGNDHSWYQSISDNGLYVTFSSKADNLVNGDTNGKEDIFVYDRQKKETTRISIASTGIQGDGDSWGPTLSADGRFVAFSSLASNLVDGDTNNVEDVFVHDIQNKLTMRISVASNGSQGNDESSEPSISIDGRYVAFYSFANNLVDGDTNGRSDIFLHDRETGQTERISVDSSGNQGDGNSWNSSLSLDARFVAFGSYATNLVAGDTNWVGDVFVHDRQTNITTRVSVASDGSQSQSPGSSLFPSISNDGRYVAFASYADNLASIDTDYLSDIFVHDRQTGETQCVSIASDGTKGNGESEQLSISADGRYIAFMSEANNLVIGDTNGYWDIFVHDRQSGKTQRVSVDTNGIQGNEDSYFPTVSADGSNVAFFSYADNLVTGDINESSDVFVYTRAVEMKTFLPIITRSHSD